MDWEKSSTNSRSKDSKSKVFKISRRNCSLQVQTNLTRVIEQPDLISSDSSTNIDSKCLKIYNSMNIVSSRVNKRCQFTDWFLIVLHNMAYCLIDFITSWKIIANVRTAKTMSNKGTCWSSSVRRSLSIGWLRNCRVSTQHCHVTN